MAFAPLDAWARVIASAYAGSGPGIAPRYWPRLALALATSTLGTVFTLPERLLTRLLFPPSQRQGAGGRAREASNLAQASSTSNSLHPNPFLGEGLRKPPPTLFVLGYYRSGTTHLHYLLSCDHQLVTPRWYQMLAPQGFAVSWSLLRFMLVPFLSSTRPQDDVAYGPEYPAEDDFGICNLAGVGTMPGRMVLPQCWDHYKRYHTLEGLSPRELERFRAAQTTLTRKLATLNPSRRLLLKSPAHTARLGELMALYGPGARFIHLHRDPTSVLRSNVAMHRRFEPFLLQDHPGDDAIRERIIAEYDATERAFLRDLDALPNSGRGVVARVRYEDLIADPVGELSRAYAELGLDFTPRFAARMVAYLRSVESYRAASQKDASERDGREAISASPELSWMHEAFGHDRPAIARRDPAQRVAELCPGVNLQPPAAGLSTLRAALIAAGVACACAIAWTALAWGVQNRHDWLIWPIGLVIGGVGLRAAGRGNARLGVITALLVLAVFVVRAWPATFLSEPRYHHPSPDRWHHVWLSTYVGTVTGKNMIWLALGMLSAGRFASREHVRPPGM